MAERPRRSKATEEQRGLERDALLSLAVASYPQRDRIQSVLKESGNVDLLAPDEALQQLAESVRRKRLAVPRLMVLNALVRLATRRGGEVFAEENEAMGDLLDALVQDAQPNMDMDLAGATEELRRGLMRLENADTAFAAWDMFEPVATRTLALTDDERWGPRCTDELSVTSKSGVVAAQVSSEFWTDRTPEQMAGWADPQTWPDCSIYFRSMEPHPKGSTQPVPYAGPPEGWDGTFLEVVDAFLGHRLETPLRFMYRKELPNAVWSTYELADPQGTADIVIDEGFLEARLKPNGPPGRPTHVRTLKVIRFRDDQLQEFVTLACDTFWTEAAITMALDCSDRGGATTTPAKKPAGKKIAGKKTAAKKTAAKPGKVVPVPDDTEGFCDPEVKADIQQLFRDAVEQATKSVETYTELAGKAATRVAEGNVDPTAWSKDLAAATALWVNDVTNVWTTWTQALNLVAGKGDGDASGDDR